MRRASCRMSIKYQIWFTWNAEREKIRLPVLPEKFNVKNGSNNQSIDLTGLGEITIMQSRPALQFSFSSFFPAGYFPGIKSIITVPPILYIRMIERWKKSTLSVPGTISTCTVPSKVSTTPKAAATWARSPTTSLSRSTGKFP